MRVTNVIVAAPSTIWKRTGRLAAQRGVSGCRLASDHRR
jgi:hypothetical protein